MESVAALESVHASSHARLREEGAAAAEVDIKRKSITLEALLHGSLATSQDVGCARGRGISHSRHNRGPPQSAFPSTVPVDA